MQWLKKWFTKKDNSKEIMHSLLNTNKALLDGYGLLQNEYQTNLNRLVIWISAITLQNSGKITLNRDFLEAILTNSNLKLKINTFDDKIEITLFDITEEKDEHS